MKIKVGQLKTVTVHQYGQILANKLRLNPLFIDSPALSFYNIQRYPLSCTFLVQIIVS
jgi:hypothetical protein